MKKEEFERRIKGWINEREYYSGNDICRIEGSFGVYKNKQDEYVLYQSDERGYPTNIMENKNEEEVYERLFKILKLSRILWLIGHMNRDTEELLVIVDMINGFVKKGALADPKIGLIIPKQLELIKDFLQRKQQIAVIKDTHTLDSTEFKTFPPHCILGTDEAEIVDELKPYIEELKNSKIRYDENFHDELNKKYENAKYVIEYKKNSTSAIFAPSFMDDLNEYKKLKRVVIAGCCTDICIMNLAIPLKNYFNQNNQNIDIIIQKDTVETYDSPVHNRDEYNEMAFKLMENAGIQLVKKYRK